MNNSLANINIYNERMAKAIEDKLWLTRFLDMTNFQDSIVYDFGCADGELIRHLAPQYPNIDFVGIDNSKDMINLARNRQMFNNERYITNNQISRINCPPGKTVIVIMSSVYHEIVNYCSNPWYEIMEVFRSIRPDYIFFRDMIPNDSINRNASLEDYNKIINKNWEDNPKYSDWNLQLLEFDIRQGSVKNQQNLVHFLLKYRYTENWDREVRENYFPCTYDKLIKNFSSIFYPVYSKQYTLPYIKNYVKEDFDIDLRDNTHVNVIFKSKENANWFEY